MEKTDFLRTQNTKHKTDRLEFIKIKMHALQKTPVRKGKASRQKKIFIIHVTDKGIASRICEGLFLKPIFYMDKRYKYTLYKTNI